MSHFKFLLAAAAIASMSSGPSAGQNLAPTPPELRLVFDSYTKHIGLDPKACSFGVWNSNILDLSAKETFDNAFARCKLPADFKACTRIAGEYPDQASVANGCIAGFERLSFLALAAVSKQGGFFIVVHDARDRPVRLAQQLALGFGRDRDFCELDVRLLDSEANVVARATYHHFTDLLADKTICRKPK